MTEGLLIAGMAVVVVLAVLQVFFRYAVGMSLSWSEEALRYLMIWVSSLGFGLAYARGDMIGMALLVAALPPRLAGWIALLGRLLVVALMLTIAWYGWQFAWRTRAATATALPISMLSIHLSVAVGAILIALHALAGVLAAPSCCRATKTGSEETAP